MKKHKRVFSLFITVIMTLAMLTACGGDEAVVNPEWEIDKDSHWHLTESGKKADVAAHSLEEGVCSVCDAEISKFDDGSIWITKSNENGDQILSMTYNADGNIVENKKSEYTYDENGKWATKKEYDNGKLYQESHFTTVSTDDESTTYADQIATYNEDGTKLVEIFDENGWSTKETKYKADGTVEYEYTIVNEFNKQDLISSIKKYDGETLVAEIKSEYDTEGNLTAEKTYSGKTLVKEDLYTNMDGYIYISKEIIYNEDGTQTVTKYDEYGEMIK